MQKTDYDPREELHLLKAQLQELSQNDASRVFSIYTSVRSFIQKVRQQSYMQGQLDVLPSSVIQENLSSDPLQCRTDMLFSLSLCQYVMEQQLPS